MLMMLSAMAASNASALSPLPEWESKVVQQNGACQGIVKDAAGEPVIGASVVVKGTTNGTITGLDGDFSLGGKER